MKKEIVIEQMKNLFDKALNMVETKGTVYDSDESDRFSHLKLGAAVEGVSPEVFTHTMVTKHFTALPFMLKRKEKYSMEKFLEYLIDIIVYTAYIYCLLLESIGPNSSSTAVVKKPKK